MTLTGPTEMDKNFISDTGLSPEQMQDQVSAYHDNMNRLHRAALEAGGYTWFMITGRGPGVRHLGPTDSARCAAQLRPYCTGDIGTTPGPWSQAHMYIVQPADVIANATSYTAEFLISRGPFAWIGYSWLGCDGTDWPRPELWDADYGSEPAAPCLETGNDTRVFTRRFAHATVEWDCVAARGVITMANGTVHV
jgi:hypothetical protein